MAIETKTQRLFIRRGTDADRKTTTLCEGELGYSTDSKRLYLGDGSTPGGNPVSNTHFLELDTKPIDDLTQVSDFRDMTNVEPEKGDLVFVHNDTPDTGQTVVDDDTFYDMYVILAKSDTGVLTFKKINDKIPYSNLDIEDDAIPGEKIEGGDISGEVTFSGTDTTFNSIGKFNKDAVFSTTSDITATKVENYAPTSTVEGDGELLPLGIRSNGHSDNTGIVGRIEAVNSINQLGKNIIKAKEGRFISTFPPVTMNIKHTHVGTGEVGISRIWGENFLWAQPHGDSSSPVNYIADYNEDNHLRNTANLIDVPASGTNKIYSSDFTFNNNNQTYPLPPNPYEYSQDNTAERIKEKISITPSTNKASTSILRFHQYKRLLVDFWDLYALEGVQIYHDGEILSDSIGGDQPRYTYWQIEFELPHIVTVLNIRRNSSDEIKNIKKSITWDQIDEFHFQHHYVGGGGAFFGYKNINSVPQGPPTDSEGNSDFDKDSGKNYYGRNISLLNTVTQSGFPYYHKTDYHIVPNIVSTDTTKISNRLSIFFGSYCSKLTQTQAENANEKDAITVDDVDGVSGETEYYKSINQSHLALIGVRVKV